ncbi:hypothetical protein SAMN05216275_10558 [Streptosporangium canum]|uniref:Uncharacterized protein n=1 Tax=Streptosporangium canum TaxID=324952 RepID=A0A1I3L9U5_9ACTN|nr:hypothetical protein [Streptosporangium canum]SFI81320.1 hypothetical protein SAMN05216275_10558 [Streptosporangium canum]
MKVDFGFRLDVSEEAWARRMGIDTARVGADVSNYVSDTLWWLPGIADSGAVPRWKKDPRPREVVDGVLSMWCRVVIEVQAGDWQEWAGVPAGRARRDLIEYVTYQLAHCTGLADAGARFTWSIRSRGPADSTTNELAALMWRWPSMRVSE